GEYGRSTHSGRIPFPFLRSQPGVEVRSGKILRHASEYPRGNRRSIRAGGHQGRIAGGTGRSPRSVWIERSDGGEGRCVHPRQGRRARSKGRISMNLPLARKQYADLYGPTVGDKVRLADTELFIEVERDLIAEAGGRGDEIVFGGGKVIRDGMGQSVRATRA